jgi:hypothetical protein
MSQTLSNAWAPTTLAKYTLAVTQYMEFCHGQGVPTPYILPASETLLCAFVSHNAGHLAGTSICNQISALKAWHITNALPWHSHEQLHYTLKGADNLTLMVFM